MFHSLLEDVGLTPVPSPVALRGAGILHPLLLVSVSANTAPSWWCFGHKRPSFCSHSMMSKAMETQALAESTKSR